MYGRIEVFNELGEWYVVVKLFDGRFNDLTGGACPGTSLGGFTHRLMLCVKQGMGGNLEKK